MQKDKKNKRDKREELQQCCTLENDPTGKGSWLMSAGIAVKGCDGVVEECVHQGLSRCLGLSNSP